MSASRHHKYLADPIETANEAGYTIEDGIVVDDTDRPNSRKVYDEWTRYWRKSKEELRAEEAAWAALSGPVTIVRPATSSPGRKTA